MKLKAIFFIVALILSDVTQGQVSRKSFEKAVDLLNCKTVELSLKGGTKFQEFQTKCPCGEANYTQINHFLTSIEKFDATIALAAEVESLKKSFNENWKKDEVVTFLSESVFADKAKYKKISTFAEKRNGKPEFVSYKKNLKIDLANNLVEIVGGTNDSSTATTEVSQSTVESRISELEKLIASGNDKSWFDGITSQILVISILVSLLLSFLTLYLSLKISKGDDSEVSANIKNYVKAKIEEDSFSRNIPGVNSSSFALTDANNRIRYLEADVKKLNERIDALNSVSNTTTKTICQESIQPEIRTEVFFLSSPNSDGSFDESSASSSYKEGATIYRFTKTGNNKANFQIDEKEASVKLALQYRDRRIDPVCEATNAYNLAKHISTVEQGEAELQSGKWIVNKKAKIKYES